MALVIDEYGGTDGLVSIEDLMEVIVGDIEDEHDEAEAQGIQKLAEGVWQIDARADVGEVGVALGVDFSGEYEEEDIDTIGGFVVMLAGRVPVRGEIVAAIDGVEFEIVDADPRKIKRLRVVSRKPAEPVSPEAETRPRRRPEVRQRCEGSPSVCCLPGVGNAG